jgi:protein-tyrosine kinase
MSIIETALSKVRGREPRPRGSPGNRRISYNEGARPDFEPTRTFPTATLDSVAMERNRILPQVSDLAALRAYKILRTRLLQRLGESRRKFIAITGTESGQGKTLTAINLSVALAQDPNTRVCLVDLDLQRPQVSNQMGMQFESGLSDYLQGQSEAESVIYSSNIPRLLVVPNSRAFENSSEMLAGGRMLQLLQFIESELPQHIVLFDMPPMMLSDDVLTFAPRVDGVLLVVAEGRTQRSSVVKSKEMLGDMNVLGVVLNSSSERDDNNAYY